jgi:RNA polymerase sigma factor (sigma-70 family)
VYNRKQIFKDAWHVKKRHNYSFKKSLKISWKYHKEKIINDNLKILIKVNEGNLNYYSSYLSRKTNIDKEDAYQVLLIKLNDAIKFYNKEKSSLKTFSNIVLKNQVSTILKQEYKKSAIRTNKEIDINLISNENNLYREFEEKHFINQISNNLDKVSKYVCQQIIIGKKNKEIADSLNYTTSNISNIIKRKIRPQLIKEFC